ncbi:MAG TPA: class I SAM-dependent methyltransferase [Mycobacteriales bacterium]|jgi:ubiquinone/menaquinone biosynthesis C-methylase UbiE
MSRGEAVFCRSAPWRAFAARVVLPWATRGATPRGEVLEVGAGSGAMAEAMLRRWPDVRVTATDVDPDMVAAAAARLPERGTAEVADATALPFADGSFDAVVSFLMLHHTIRWEDVVAECARVLRPGGVLLGYDLLDTRTARVIHRVDGSPHRLLSQGALRMELVRRFSGAEVSRALLGQVARFRATR